MHILLAYVHFLLYLCTAFSFREASEILAQTRCCDSQSNVHHLQRSLPQGGKAGQRSDKSEDLLYA